MSTLRSISFTLPFILSPLLAVAGVITTAAHFHTSDPWFYIGAWLLLCAMGFGSWGLSLRRSRSMDDEFEAGYRAGYRAGRRAPLGAATAATVTPFRRPRIVNSPLSPAASSSEEIRPDGTRSF